MLYPNTKVTSSPVDTVLDWAQAAGMRTGLVTTARVSFASLSVSPKCASGVLA